MDELAIQESSNSDLIRSRIFTIRGVQVILDKDLAELYGVEVSQLNRQVKRNIERFPDDFMFQLTREECSRCQIGILNGSRSSWRLYSPMARRFPTSPAHTSVSSHPDIQEEQTHERARPADRRRGAGSLSSCAPRQPPSHLLQDAYLASLWRVLPVLVRQPCVDAFLRTHVPITISQVFVNSAFQCNFVILLRWQNECRAKFHLWGLPKNKFHWQNLVENVC